MHLIINNYGVKIEVEEEQFSISLNEEQRCISPAKLSSINVLKAANITTPALVLAAKHQIPVLIYNNRGKVEVWTTSATYRNIADIRKAQCYFSDSPEAVVWVQALLIQKTDAQIQCLQYLKNRVIAQTQAIDNVIEKLTNAIPELKTYTQYAQMSGWEGNIARQYWDSIHEAIAKKVTIEGRVHHNPQDIFNAGINYGYGILYGIVEASLLQVGLDPYMGFMHTNRYQEPALAFDHIEPFRPWVDKMLIALILTHQLQNSDLILDEQGYYRLNKAARVILIDAFFAKMEERSYLNGKRIKNIDHIRYLYKQLVIKLKEWKK